MRLDGHDPVRLLLVESSQVQTDLERPQVYSFERDRFRRHINLKIIDGDPVEFVVGGDKLRVQIGELRQFRTTAQLQALPQRPQV